ncbi:energy transducer TonB [Kaarinaea lacus]
MQLPSSSYGKHRVLNALRHWSPLIVLSLLANVGFLYLFAFLIAVAKPAATEKSRIHVRLIQNQPQAKMESLASKVPEPAEPVKSQDKAVKKTKPEAPKPTIKPPPPKKVVQVKKPEPPPPPQEKLDEPAEPVEVSKNEIPEPATQESAEVNEQNTTLPIASLLLPPQAPIVADVVPLFRLTRMPKVVDYNLETLKRFYPEEERDFGKEATVEAMILVDENGNILEVEILKSAGTRFDAAAKKALLSNALVIQPGYVGDKPVASRVPIPITFNLTE